MAEYDDVIRRAIDAQLELEHKAQAWDELRAAVDKQPWGYLVLEMMDGLVHPARTHSS